MSQADLKRYLSIGHFVLSVCAGAALAYLAGKIASAALGGSLFASIRGVPTATLALAAVIYMFGHLLRSVRLALLIGGWNVGLRLITSFHFMTAGVSLAAPLKLGEIYRVLELSNLVGSLTRAIEIVWLERLMDVMALVVIMAVALNNVSPANFQPFVGVVVLAVVFIAVSALTLFVLPDNLRRTSILIIRRYDHRATLPLLRLLSQVRNAILEAPRIVHGKVGSLAALTVLIWTCEVACFGVLLGALGYNVAAAPDALLRFLSVLTRGQTLVGVLDAPVASGARDFLPYLAATQVPLALIGLVAGLAYVIQRVSRRRQLALYSK